MRIDPEERRERIETACFHLNEGNYDRTRFLASLYACGVNATDAQALYDLHKPQLVSARDVKTFVSGLAPDRTGRK